MERSFSSEYELCSKSIETEAVFTKTEMSNEWNNFLQYKPVGIKHTSSSNLHTGRSTPEPFFLKAVK